MTLAMGLFLMGLTGLGVGFMQDFNVKHVKDLPPLPGCAEISTTWRAGSGTVAAWP
jgi:hypothetical protein